MVELLRSIELIGLIDLLIISTFILLHHVAHFFDRCSQNSVSSNARLGWARSLPVTAGNQGDPKERTNTPPGVRDVDGFLLASLASGQRTTPMDRAMVVEGTPLRQRNSFAVGPYSLSDDEDGSPTLLSEPEPSAASASTGTMAAAFNPAAVAAALAEILESSSQLLANDRLRSCDYDTNMATFGGCLSRFERIFSKVNESIGVIWADSASLVTLNKHTSTVVDNSIADFIWTMENNATKNAAALEDYNQRTLAMTAAHLKSIGDMQVKLQGSFDRMKYLEKTFQDVPGLITTHLEAQLPAILTNVVGTALAPTLTTVLNKCLPRTMTDVLEGSLTDFQSRLGAAGGAEPTLRVQELLEAAADSHDCAHTAVMTVIEDIGACLSALDDVFASSAVPCPITNHTPMPPPVATRPTSSVHVPVPSTWGHNFQPSPPAPPPPAPPPPPSPSMVHGLCVDTAHAGVPGGRIKTPRSIDPARRAWDRKTNRFDLAGLADAGYHVGDDGVAVLNEMIISNCGYQSFHVDHPEDVLLCFQEIINLHRVVVQTWTNTRTQFSGPVVEYILKKALPVFPRLQDLDVAGMVKFYNGLQKISMRYLLPIMPFDSISLAFGFEGLCPLAWAQSVIPLSLLPGWMCSLAFSLNRNPWWSRLFFLWVLTQTTNLTLCGGFWNSRCRDSSLSIRFRFQHGLL
jgi:hypothetical protein